MGTSTQVQRTDFSRDVFGRYFCNGFDEAVASTRGGTDPFHYIIIGGGTYGGALASFLFNLDPPTDADFDPFKRYRSRILVLEAGPFLLPEHEQNLAEMGIGTPSPSSIAALQPVGTDGQRPAIGPRAEVWGLPWHSDDDFPGLAYCIGGRSVFWGGWAPRYVDTEMPTSGASPWPRRVVEDLKARHFYEAAEVLGVNDPNDFVFGELHTKMLEYFFEAIQDGKIKNAIPLAELPFYTATDGPPASVPNAEKYKLDAPYAVQAATRSGFFPFNKFSSVPILMTAARRASHDALKTKDSVLNDSRKQVMVVPNCHVARLRTLPVGTDGSDIRRVVAIETNQGVLDVGHNTVVIFAMGAIESARMAMDSFGDVRSHEQMGKNLMCHVRSNAYLSVRRDAEIGGQKPFEGISWQQLEVSAIQLRGRIDHQENGSPTAKGHFHLQIVASGVAIGADGNAPGPDSEIFRKIPDIEQVNFFRENHDQIVSLAIRGCAEMAPLHETSRVELDPEPDEFGVRRAFVRINDDQERNTPAIRNLSDKDADVKTAMIQMTNEVLALFGEDGKRTEKSEPFQEPEDSLDFGKKHIKLDGLGTMYHEFGTLRMGEDPARSVVNPDLRFHGVTNAYATDMSVVPTCGSANPVQIGVALSRRLARHLARPERNTVPPGGMFLFRDVPTPFWRVAGAPSTCANFGLGEIVLTSAGGPFGLYWCTIPTPAHFELTVEWLSTDPTDNSGIFFGFPDPNLAPPGKSKAFLEPGFIAVEYGFELQIDNTNGGGDPKDKDGNPVATGLQRFRGTGAIYNEDRQQLVDPLPAFLQNQWHTFIIRAQGPAIEVRGRVNGGAAQPITRFTYDVNNYRDGDLRKNSARGLPTGDAGGDRYIGLQAHNQTKQVRFRNIYLKPI